MGMDEDKSPLVNMNEHLLWVTDDLSESVELRLVCLSSMAAILDGHVATGAVSAEIFVMSDGVFTTAGKFEIVSWDNSEMLFSEFSSCGGESE